MMTLVLVGLLALLAVAGVGFALVGGDDSSAKALKRAHTVVGATKVERVRRNVQDQAVTRRKQILQNLKTVERQQRKQTVTLEGRLRQAGLSWSVATFWMVSGGVALVFGLPALVFTKNILIALGVCFGTGFGLPRWVIGFLATRRVKKFTSEFPNATDIIVRGIKSGLPVHECLKVIAAESPEPLAAEFKRLVESLGMGLTMEEALEKVYQRMPTAEVRFFAIVLSIQSKTGGNLAEALGNLSSVLRARKLMREKIKAMASEAVASAAIIGVLPPGILVTVAVTTPSYMMPMFTDSRGHFMLMIGGFWMGCGIMVMRKMINFKF